MKRNSLIFGAFFLSVLGATAWADTLEGPLADKYSDFETLKLNEVENVDYQIQSVEIGAPVLIQAIHGGEIEFESTQIAQAVAADDMNFYSFEGIKSSGNNWDLHITSTNFDEPTALAMAQGAETCVSVHGFDDPSASIACVGGGDQKFAAQIASALASSGVPLQVEFPCMRFPGAEPANIVNRCQNQGVQLELSSGLRRELSQNIDELNDFVKAVRSSVIDYYIFNL